MKIAAVRCHALRAPIEDAFYYSQGYYGARGAVLLEVRTDDGALRVGGLRRDAALLPAYVAAHLAPRLVGRDPRDWQRLWHALGGLGALEGATPAPCTRRPERPGALLDLAGKAAGVPVYRLLGGAFRERIKVYATGLYRLQRWQTLDAWREGLVQEALGYRAEGFSLCKVKIGFRPQDDVRLVHAVREAVGDQMGVAVDANCAWDAATAIRVGRQLESAGVAWFEEPLPPGDLAGYREVRRALAIPVSGGESLAGLRRLPGADPEPGGGHRAAGRGRLRRDQHAAAGAGPGRRQRRAVAAALLGQRAQLRRLAALSGHRAGRAARR